MSCMAVVACVKQGGDGLQASTLALSFRMFVAGWRL